MTNVVIGAASGMGIEVARRLAARGPLLLVDRDLEGVERLAGQLAGDRAGDRAECEVATLRCDIDATRPRSTPSPRPSASSTALVVTAGLAGALAPARVIYEVNLRGMERRAAGGRPARGRGIGRGAVRVRFRASRPRTARAHGRRSRTRSPPTSSTALVAEGIDPDDAQLAYSVRSAASCAWSRGRAASWGARGARILSLSPGSTQTEMSLKQQAATPQQAQFIASSPLGRRGRPEEIAEVADVPHVGRGRRS